MGTRRARLQIKPKTGITVRSSRDSNINVASDTDTAALENTSVTTKPNVSPNVNAKVGLGVQNDPGCSTPRTKNNTNILPVSSTKECSVREKTSEPPVKTIQHVNRNINDQTYISALTSDTESKTSSASVVCLPEVNNDAIINYTNSSSNIVQPDLQISNTNDNDTVEDLNYRMSHAGESDEISQNTDKKMPDLGRENYRFEDSVHGKCDTDAQSDTCKKIKNSQVVKRRPKDTANKEINEEAKSNKSNEISGNDDVKNKQARRRRLKPKVLDTPKEARKRVSEPPKESLTKASESSRKSEENTFDTLTDIKKQDCQHNKDSKEKGDSSNMHEQINVEEIESVIEIAPEGNDEDMEEVGVNENNNMQFLKDKKPVKKYQHHRTRCHKKILEKKDMKMLDLIYWNPTENPMKSSNESQNDKEKNKNISNTMDTDTSHLEEEQVDDPTHKKDNDNLNDDDENVPGPRVRVNEDGEIILDEASLVIKQTANAEKDHLDPEIVHESTGQATYSSFRKSKSYRVWKVKETAKFYKALSICGTDFTLMSNLFSKRTREELKNKYKREEKLHKPLVERAVRDPMKYKIADFELDSNSGEEEERLTKNKTSVGFNKRKFKNKKECNTKQKRPCGRKKRARRSYAVSDSSSEGDDDLELIFNDEEEEEEFVNDPNDEEYIPENERAKLGQARKLSKPKKHTTNNSSSNKQPHLKPLNQEDDVSKESYNSEINMFHITCPVICSMDEEPSSPSLIYKKSLNSEHLPNGITPLGISSRESKETLPSTSTDTCIPVVSEKTSVSVPSEMSTTSIISPTIPSLQQGMSPNILRSQDQLILLASSSPQQGHVVHVYLLSPSDQRPEESVGNILTEGE
ncbi:transcription factor TFIIIB component B'' homolog [Limulus polyphemus]|uniref:Transcription factor TFIIIB component B'' homolog n=1 Tax=Limulus polyphemus TaxID=6850 RepID=A0ABM1BYH7_LIMPO|nr:transcription factor TFIIIB component B'' homolog [Limulus polyphemus]